MDSYLYNCAGFHPGDIAIEDGSHTLSYRELEQAVGKLATVLKSFHLNPEEPVCVLEGISSNMIIAQLAVLRASLTCVPIDPSTPELRLLDMLRDVGSKHILTDQDAPNSQEFVIIPISGHQVEDNEECSPSRDRGSKFRSHILYTSGSDMSLFEIFAPLTAGGTLVIVPREVTTDPFTFREFAAEKNLTIVFLTVALFSITAQACPTAFANV